MLGKENRPEPLRDRCFLQVLCFRAAVTLVFGAPAAVTLVFGAPAAVTLVFGARPR